MMYFRGIASVFLVGCFVFNGFGLSVPREKGPLGATFAAAAERYIRTELFFGLSRKGGPDVSEAEFETFVDEFVTPRFPDGFTILDARGRWREDDGKTASERTKVLVIIYRRSERRPANAKIEEIRNEYKKRFSQSSVLRADITKGIKVDF